MEGQATEKGSEIKFKNNKKGEKKAVFYSFKQESHLPGTFSGDEGRL